MTSLETLLNAIWVLVCAALVLTWHAHCLSQIRRRVRPDAVQQSFISLVCLLALLFPAISLSDDLHPQIFALPDTKSSSVAAFSHSQAAAQSPVHTPHTPTAGLPLLPFAHRVLSLASSVISSESHIDFLSSAIGVIAGRAPPTAIL